MEALRFNENKTRFDLLNSNFTKCLYCYPMMNLVNRFSKGEIDIYELNQKLLIGIDDIFENKGLNIHTETIKVLEFGAKKYSEYNWQKGMKWSKCIASLQRHLYTYYNGIEVDEESGLHHLSHALCNLMFLYEYHKLCPELDDRPFWKQKQKSIGLDIDGVIADFTTAYCEKFNVCKDVKSYQFDGKVFENLSSLNIYDIDEFYLNMMSLLNPISLNFIPSFYITAREKWVDNNINMKWLYENGFPNYRNVFNVNNKKDKIEVIKANNIDIFVEDDIESFYMFKAEGIDVRLMNQSYNEYDKKLDSYRIYHLNELV